MKSPHKMIREILEEPKVSQTLLTKGFKQVQEIARVMSSRRYEMVYLTGSGTSYHAGLAAQYAISRLTRFMTSSIPASEFSSWVPANPRRRSVLIAISQSGESSDVLTAAKAALQRNIDILAVTNTENSSLVKMSQYALLTRAGREFAVTATKSYVAQLLALFLLSAQFAETEEIQAADSAKLRRLLFKSPKIISETIKFVDRKVHRLADEYGSQFFFLLGSGPNYATALEGALKLKEACNIFAEGFASREFLHGPIQLVDKRTSLFFIVTEDQLEDTVREIKSVRTFDASVLSISERMDKQLKEASNDVIRVPKGFPKVFSPLTYIIPLQLFAYYSSITRGLNPDKPEKLVKVVK